MKRRLLSLALALALCMGLCVVPAAADNGFHIENGVLLWYGGPGGNITIPDGVTSIRAGAFDLCDGLTGITIPSSVTSIADGGFVANGKGLTFYVTAGSYAETWAKEKGNTFTVIQASGSAAAAAPAVGYAPLTITLEEGSITFSAAYAEVKTASVDNVGWGNKETGDGYEPATVCLVTIHPDCKITLSGAPDDFGEYWVEDGGKSYRNGQGGAPLAQAEEVLRSNAQAAEKLAIIPYREHTYSGDGESYSNAQDGSLAELVEMWRINESKSVASVHLMMGPAAGTGTISQTYWGPNAPTSNGHKADYLFIALGDKTVPATSATPEKPAAAPGFTDVADNSPFKDAIAWAVEQKITNGTSATTFSPSNTCTHNHILTFIWRANGSLASEGANDFAKAIAWAKASGMADSVTGGDGCTRAQAMVYLWKLAGSPKPGKAAAFDDVDASAPYAQAVAWAVEKGITKGTSATAFSPDNVCTRGQIVTFLYRSLKK